jgi:four helix bundle protein
MATIKTFEDLEIWKNAQDLGAKIYFLCNSNEKIAKDFSFKDQIKRASLSISNNIAEGFEYSNNNDFYRFLRIAKGSCGEVMNCLLFSIRVEYTLLQDVGGLIEFSRNLGKQIGSLMKYLKENKMTKKNNPQPVTRNS